MPQNLSADTFAEHLLQHMPVPAFVLDTQHRVLIWNSACATLTGIEAKEVLGTNQHWRGFYAEPRPCLADLLLDRSLGQLSSLYEQIYDSETGETTLHSENWCPMPDGRRLYLVIDAAAITDAQGNIVAVVETQRDRTQQRLMMQALEESQQRYSAMLSATMDAIIVIDQQQYIRIFNTAAEKTFRCSADLAVGQPIERFIAPRSQASFKHFLSVDTQTPDKPTWVPEGLNAKRADGEEFSIEATFSPLEAGGQQLCMLILRDINDRRLAEQKLDQLQLEKGYLQEVIDYERNFGEVVSASEQMRAVFEQAQLVARTDTPVLLLGETGTGKELLARGIHAASPRHQAILVKINCAALPADLIESELFGHEKGAFTGALQQRKGRFELANGGTLLLDEVGELPPAAQAKLLRVLQEQEFERVGGSETLRVDVRIISATNRNLAEEVAQGRFRADLYYRLSVFPIDVPALRERPTDIPLLAHFFLAKYAQKLGKRIDTIGPISLQQLVRYAWPGNVRELQNVIERAVILCRGSTLEIGPLLNLLPEPAVPETRTATLEEIEREHILRTLSETGWVISGPKGAAARLNINPNTLRSRMQKLGISKKR